MAASGRFCGRHGKGWNGMGEGSEGGKEELEKDRAGGEEREKREGRKTVI